MPPSTANVCKSVILILTFSLGFNGNLAAAESKSGHEESSEASGGLFEALTSGRFKALLRYSAQRRNSNLHMLQDGSEPIPPTEKLQYYSAVGGQDSYTVLGELFIRYQHGAHLLKAGRQEMSAYRLVSLSNIRMTPVTHSRAGFQYDFGLNGMAPGLVMRWRLGYYNLPDGLLQTDARQEGPGQHLTFVTLLQGPRASEFSPK